MPLPLLAAAGLGLGSSLLAGGLGSLASRKGRQQQELENRFLAGLDPERYRADLAENYYLDQAMRFDPSAALQQYGQAAYGDFERKLKRAVADLGGRAVGAGRLDTGFYDEDQGRLVSDLARQYQEALGSRALEAAQMNLSRLQGIGSYGAAARNTYLDMLASQMDREEAERNARRRLWTDAFGSGLGSAATLYGLSR